MLDLEYDPAVNSDYWQRRPVAVVSRAIQIGAAFGGWFVAGRLRLSADPERVAAATLRQAEHLRDILTRLGPAFVKIGQVRNVQRSRHLSAFSHRRARKPLHPAAAGSSRAVGVGS